MTSDDLSAARQALLKGVIAYPTEAVFGLGCDPRNDEAIQRVLDLKQRPVEKGLILIAADYSQLLPYVDDQAIGQDKRFSVLSHWPGPTTLILPARPSVSRLITGEHDTIAVRVTAFEPARELCRRLGTALVSTSANPAGETPAVTAAQVNDYFGERVDWTMAEPTGGGESPSRIIDPLNNKVLREQ